MTFAGMRSLRSNVIDKTLEGASMHLPPIASREDLEVARQALLMNNEYQDAS
jgi:hypothetical protein